MDGAALVSRFAISRRFLRDIGARPVNPEEDQGRERGDAGIGDGDGSAGEGEEYETEELATASGATSSSAPSSAQQAAARGGALAHEGTDGPEAGAAGDILVRGTDWESDFEDVFGHGGALDEPLDEVAYPAQHLHGPEAKRRRRDSADEDNDGPAVAEQAPVRASSSHMEVEDVRGARGVKRSRDDLQQAHGEDRAQPEEEPLAEVSGQGAGSGSALGEAQPERGRVRVSGRWGHGHKIAFVGPVAWCEDCGRYAIQRVGRGLADACPGRIAAGSAARRRVERLRSGRHPITGARLT